MCINTGIETLDNRIFEYFPKKNLDESNLAVIGYKHLALVGTESLKEKVVVLLLTERQESLINDIHEIGAVSIVTLDNRQSPRSVTQELVAESLLLMREQLGTPDQFFNALKAFSQPIYSAHDLNSPSSFEILARLQFGSGRLITPNVIFKWINPVDSALIFEHLLRQTEQNHTASSFSFNIDCASVLSTEGFSIIQRAVETHNSKTLTLEITESAFSTHVRDINLLNSRFEILRRLGVRFSLDDFGKKNSNYDRLHAYSDLFSQVKLDKKLFRQLSDHSVEDKADIQESIHEASSRLIKLLDAMPISVTEVVVEGIETPYQSKVIQQLHKDLKGSNSAIEIKAQGYLFGRPAPFEMDGRSEIAI